MIFENQKVIFIHYPKTGGNSIQDVLRSHTADELFINVACQDGIESFGVRNKKFKDLKKHSTLNDYHQVLGQKIYDYQIFIFIRNPFDRLVSFYFSRHRGNPDFDRGAFSKLIDRVPPLENFISIQTASGDEFTIYNKMKLMRFESLSEGFSELCASLGVTDMKLPHRNASARNGYREYYDEELIQKIETIHGYEISLGNYEF